MEMAAAADWSDPARYAYASLFALSLNERDVSGSCDFEFRQQSLRRLLEHVKLMRVCFLFWFLIHRRQFHHDFCWSTNNKINNWADSASR